MDGNLEIKLAERSNFTEFSMDLFDRFQKVQNIYHIDENGSLHVSHNYRQHGIGQRLVETAVGYAINHGAEALYASCCSAEETIDFIW